MQGVQLGPSVRRPSLSQATLPGDKALSLTLRAWALSPLSRCTGGINTGNGRRGKGTSEPSGRAWALLACVFVGTMPPCWQLAGRTPPWFPEASPDLGSPPGHLCPPDSLAGAGGTVVGRWPGHYLPPPYLLRVPGLMACPTRPRASATKEEGSVCCAVKNTTGSHTSLSPRQLRGPAQAWRLMTSLPHSSLVGNRKLLKELSAISPGPGSCHLPHIKPGLPLPAQRP